MTIDRPIAALLASISIILAASCGGDGEGELLLGATTSVQDTGLLDELVSAFEDATGYDVKPVVGGSGQIIETARRGEFDVILTHSPEDEDQFIADGEGLDKRRVMRNFFLIAGAEDDAADAGKASTLAEAFERMAAGEHRFISRGDESGTHRRELSIWQELGLQPEGEPWYEESATGQGQNLLVASDKDAYTLVDSSTFTVFRDRVSLRPLLTDAENPNAYSVIRISSEKHPDVNSAGAIAFAEFVTSAAGQCLIDSFGLETHGQQLFEPVTGCEASLRALAQLRERRDHIFLASFHNDQVSAAKPTPARNNIQTTVNMKPANGQSARSVAKPQVMSMPAVMAMIAKNEKAIAYAIASALAPGQMASWRRWDRRLFGQHSLTLVGRLYPKPRFPRLTHHP